MTSTTVALDPAGLDAAIKVASSAAVRLALTPGARRSYRALLFCTDGMVLSMLAAVALLVAVSVPGSSASLFVPMVLAAAAFMVFEIVAIALLALNAPMAWRTLAERRRLRALGVASVTESLWRDRRRHRWADRARSAVVLTFATLMTLGGLLSLLDESGLKDIRWSSALLVAAPGVLLVSRHLRRCREQMDLAADAGALAAALRSLRPQEGAQAPVAVPADLLQQAAGIEHAQIAEARQRAIAGSAASRARSRVIRFDATAADQRSALQAAERLALDDLLADLSADASAVPGEAGPDQNQRIYRADGLSVLAELDLKAQEMRILAIDRTGQAAAIGPREAPEHQGAGSHAT